MKQTENNTVAKTSDQMLEDKTYSQRLEKGYYHCMEKDIALYNVTKVRYTKYISLDYLKQCVHEFDAQLNEVMNTSVASYAQKRITYCTTTSLRTRGTYSGGYSTREVSSFLVLDFHFN